MTGPDGGRQRLSPAVGSTTVTDTTRPGLYTVRQKGPVGVRTSRFVVQLQDPSQSTIAPGPRPAVPAAARAPGRAQRGVLELWPWLALAALVGLTVEWVVYLRG